MQQGVIATHDTAWSRVRATSRTNLALAAVVALLLGGAAGYWVWSEPTTYESRSLLTLVFAKPTTANDAPLLKVDLLRQKYASLAATTALIHPVALALNVPDSVVEHGSVVDAPTRTFVLVSTGRTSDPRLSERLAEQMASQIVAYVDAEHAVNTVPNQESFRFEHVDAPPHAQKIEPDLWMWSGAGVGGAIVSFALLYVVLQLATARRRGV